MRRLMATLLIAHAAIGSVAAAPPACAGPAGRAVLVVDTGEDTSRYCVALPTEQVSGTELISLAGRQHGLAYRFGYGGDAVCMLAGVGASGDDCFERYPDFWGYWRGDGGGGWAWASSGPGSTTVGDGDVEGWTWGSGDDGASHPSPPPTRFEDVCSPSDERPVDEASAPRSDRGSSDPAPTSRKERDEPVAEAPGGSTARVPRREREHRVREAGREKRRAVVTSRSRRRDPGSPSAASPPAAAPAAFSESAPDTSLPAAVLGVSAAMTLAGWLIGRKRRRE